MKESFGASLIIITITALFLFICNQVGIVFQTIEMVAIIGGSVTILSLIVELGHLRPTFLSIPLWAIGIIPASYGVFQILGGLGLLTLLPLIFIESFIADRSKKEQMKEAEAITHHYIDHNSDELRHQIEERRELMGRKSKGR